MQCVGTLQLCCWSKPKIWNGHLIKTAEITWRSATLSVKYFKSSWSELLFGEPKRVFKACEGVMSEVEDGEDPFLDQLTRAEDEDRSDLLSYHSSKARTKTGAGRLA